MKTHPQNVQNAHDAAQTIAIDASRSFVHERTGIEEYAYQVVKHLREPLAEAPVVLYVRLQEGFCDSGTVSFFSHQKLTAERSTHKKSSDAARRRIFCEERIPCSDKLDVQKRNSAKPCHDVCVKSFIEKNFFALPDAWRVVVVPRKRLWTQVGLAWAMWRDRPDALFVPAHTVPWIHPHNTVVVVHGLEYEMTPQAYSTWARLYMRATIKASCRWARRIVTVSKNTKRDVARLYGVPEDKMTVVYEGVNAVLTSCNPPVQRRHPMIEGAYFFFVGRIEERKNIVRVVAAFDMFKAHTGLAHKLVLAGGHGYGYERVAQAIAQTQYKQDIVECGFVSDEEKWHLMRHAQVFVFPTLYEGFGMPVLEAQSVDVPVLTSNISSLPEVAGTGAAASALLVDPTDVVAIATALERLATDEALRRDIIAKGKQNRARFNWAQCAREIAHMLDMSQNR